ncbi:hypothetical protein L6452_32065 [Arctium lappa]|uniref:Uncharacterized protein n=1 Tax=Arctium lappa TaxID=4217 RepID=A0ACB8Z399_ARCLA|nr:hypothetical protein L6452_32065 [Arctium lappa]
MENDNGKDMEDKVWSSSWPEDIDAAREAFSETPKADQDFFKDVTLIKEPTIVDFQHLIELTNNSEIGSSQLSHLVKNWEKKQEKSVRLLREEFDNLSKQHEVELKTVKILEKHPASVPDEVYEIFQHAPKRQDDVFIHDIISETDGEYDTDIKYWKQRALHLEKSLEESVQREHELLKKLEESIEKLEKQSSPVEELSQILKRDDNFLHFVLQNAPVVIGHQDKELRYRFLYNYFPSLQAEDIIGKTDLEIFKGGGVKESRDFKKEVLERGLPGKKEITFGTELFGAKTFLMYVEPVFSKAGESIGVNYMGMDMTDQVRKREKMAKLREEIAVQKARETELNKTIHITEETKRAKQTLATMSQDIKSPLSEIVNVAEILLSTTKLDNNQIRLVSIVLSSGDLVLQCVNDILDLLNVESGVTKLETTKFRPREMIKRVLETAAASLRKMLILEGNVADDVPIEVIGDVLRIQRILTNLISNAVKFTHEGKVGINLYVVANPCPKDQKKPKIDTDSLDDHEDYEPQSHETVVWVRCDIQDTGIGIPETALPLLFKKNAKDSGNGLGLAVCKKLVELMGGSLTVSSKEHCGSTFTFVLPHKVPLPCEGLDETDASTEDDGSCGFFQFKPSTLALGSGQTVQAERMT